MSENYAQTPTQQFIAKLRECEPAMALKQGNVAYLEALDTLKNSNPTVIAMLERAIGALEERAKALTRESDSAYNGESYQLANMLQCEADYCAQALADLDALAREALKEKTDAE